MKVLVYTLSFILTNRQQKKKTKKEEVEKLHDQQKLQNLDIQSPPTQ